MKTILFLVVLLNIIFGIAAQGSTGEASTTDNVGTTTGVLTGGTTGDVIPQEQVTLRIEGTVDTFNQTTFTSDLSSILGIAADRIQILNVTSGSVVIQFVILPSNDPNAPAPNAVVQDLSQKVQNTTLMTSFGITVLNYTVVTVGGSTTGSAATTGAQSTTGSQSTTGTPASTTGVNNAATTGAAEQRTISSGSSNGPSSGAIAGAVIGSILGFMVLVSVAAIIYRRSSQRDNTRHLEAGIELVAPNKKSEESSDDESEDEDDDEEEDDSEEEKKEETKKEEKKEEKKDEKKDAKKEESSSEEESSESESD